MDSFSRAATNRSIRTIKTELDFLLDSNLLTSQQVSSIHALLPDAPNGAASHISPSPSPMPQMNNLHISSPPPLQQPQPTPFNEKSAYNEQKQHAPSPAPTPQMPPPPAYNAAPGIAMARALYAYQPTDDGDLALNPQDRVTILEYMNADWAKGRSERTGDEGIFPRSYVKIEEEKGGPPPLPPINQGYGQPAQSNYGNMPLDVSQGGAAQNGQPGEPSKAQQQGKKFGKKLGNAAVFGAGATIGSNIVNSIF